MKSMYCVAACLLLLCSCRKDETITSPVTDGQKQTERMSVGLPDMKAAPALGTPVYVSLYNMSVTPNKFTASRAITYSGVPATDTCIFRVAARGTYMVFASLNSNLIHDSYTTANPTTTLRTYCTNISGQTDQMTPAMVNVVSGQSASVALTSPTRVVVPMQSRLCSLRVVIQKVSPAVTALYFQTTTKLPPSLVADNTVANAGNVAPYPKFVRKDFTFTSNSGSYKNYQAEIMIIPPDAVSGVRMFSFCLYDNTVGATPVLLKQVNNFQVNVNTIYNLTYTMTYNSDENLLARSSMSDAFTQSPQGRLELVSMEVLPMTE